MYRDELSVAKQLLEIEFRLIWGTYKPQRSIITIVSITILNKEVNEKRNRIRKQSNILIIHGKLQ